MTPSFPLVAGTVSAQLPLERVWTPAQAALMTPGGGLHLRKLPVGESIAWHLKFARLTAMEAETLRAFHYEMRGSYHSFRFCDPLRNLLAWSEDLTQPEWASTGAMSITFRPGSVWSDETTQILNLSGTEGIVQQTVACSPQFPYSMYVRAKSSSRNAIGLMIGGHRRTVSLGEQWNEWRFSAMPGGSSDQVTFAVAIPMGGAVELGGVHAEFGVSSPEYKRSEGRQGLFAKARFRDDILVLSSQERGVISAEATVVARLEG